MLVLTRKTKQQIQIGPNVTITILQIKGKAVRVGIEAPRELCVLRAELTPQASTGKALSGRTPAEKKTREAEISEDLSDEDMSGRALATANGSSRCRVPRVDLAPLNSPYQSTSPASFLRPRRRRLALG